MRHQHSAPVAWQRDKVVFLHTPKTGGAAMEYYLYEQLRNVRRNYFLSFSGVDDSRFISDDLSTQRELGNHCLIEQIFADPSLVETFKNSPHFRQASLLFGHTTCAFGELFPDCSFRYLTVLREPIERTISNIAQLSTAIGGSVKFGAYSTTSEKLSDEYWDFIYDILIREYPVSELLVHENLYLRNCMTHILQGSRYLDVHEEPNLAAALANAMRIKVSFFDEFNAGLQRSFDALGIPVDMSMNLRARHGKPDVDKARTPYGRYCNAPQKVIDFVADHNQTDIRLYDILRIRQRLETPREDEETFKGWTMYQGILAHQAEGYLPVWAAFLNQARPARVLDIGTSDGGFILSLREQVDITNPACEIRSYDIVACDTHADLIAKGVDVRIENLFTYPYDALRAEKREEIKRFIQAAGTSVIICDGGSKKNEFNLLAPLLKDGDFILAHDYAETEQHFQSVMRGRLWNWCEITEEDIRDVSRAAHLKPFMKEAFASIAWVCKQRAPGA